MSTTDVDRSGPLATARPPSPALLEGWDDIRRQLERELRATADRLKRTEEASTADAEPFLQQRTGLDVVDEVQANEAREALFASRERLLTRLERLRAALARLEAGSYGRCVECGAGIGAARLRAIPDATTCVACQGRHEQAGPSVPLPRHRSFESVEAGAILAEATAAATEAALPDADAPRADTPGARLVMRDDPAQALDRPPSAIRVRRRATGRPVPATRAPGSRGRRAAAASRRRRDSPPRRSRRTGGATGR